MGFSLHQLTSAELEGVAASRGLPGLAARMEDGAMPPSFVAARSLLLRSQGHGDPWATSFLIVRDSDQRIVGGCGFKSVPIKGRVDLGYAVAPAAQGQGAATAALTLLCRLAFDAGATSVLAEIVPDNLASMKVVQKCGFCQSGSRTDDEGDFVNQWVLQHS